MPDTMTDAHAIMKKIEELEQQITASHGIIRDLEDQETATMADAFLSGNGDPDPLVAQLQSQLARARAQLADQERVRPILCERLQAARQVLRQARGKAHTETIAKAVARQEEIKRQIAALDAQRLPLIQEFPEVESEINRCVNERSRLQQARDAWRGTLEALEALAHDPEAGVRPDEIARVLADWRAQEQREGCKINHVELGYETATGTITHAGITNQQGKEELRELQIIRQEREVRRAAQAERQPSMAA